MRIKCFSSHYLIVKPIGAVKCRQAAKWNYFCSVIHTMRKLYILVCCALALTTVQAQAQPARNPSSDTEIPMPKIPPMRVLHHDYIDNAQKTILKLDGKDDAIFAPTNNDETNLQITAILKIEVNNMQAKIELNTALDDNAKFKWLRGINEMLQGFINGYRLHTIKGVLLGDLIMAYEDAMEAELKGQSIKPIVERNDMSIGDILVQNFALKGNPGIAASKEVLMLKACYRYPQRVMTILTRNPNVYFADSIIRSIAYKDPEQLYNYAAAPDALGRKIQSVNDPLVKNIGLLALMKTGRMFFPFLDNIYRKKITIDSIQKAMGDENAYYKLLVNTEIEYAGRALKGDTAFVMNVLTNKLKAKAIENYINEINALHDEKDDRVRFKKLEPLSAQDLYYVAVLGEEEIYTSSYLGVYKRMFDKMKTPSADTLLAWVNHDYYKKFIKIAANYNTLDDFLKRMDKANTERLMRDFVTGLEKTKTLEDAVDVADSYASIYNPDIRRLILGQVEKNLAESELKNDKRGQTIYNLLNIIFLSMDSLTHIDLISRLGIDGIYEMPISQLKDSSGRIVIQQFFYGDKDGQAVFNSFLTHYRTPAWKIVNKPEWVEVWSTKGTKITIYCNKPFDNEQDLDAKAQENLGRYLEENGLYPTVVIHRGHSYYVQSTLEQLPSSAKVVLLGSCGGYQRLSDVLDNCPGAHIIASKQTGTGVVNITLITSIVDQLQAGKNLDWPAMWKNMQSKFKGDIKERFDDYVPPYKNLGAIFIMAYKKAMEAESDN